MTNVHGSLHLDGHVKRTRHILWSRQYHMVGVHTQGAMLVLILVTIPVSIIWVFLGPILVALHQDKEIAAQPQHCCNWMVVYIGGLSLKMESSFQSKRE